MVGQLGFQPDRPRIDSHSLPPEFYTDFRRLTEPEGERLRSELTDWLEKNGIVSIVLDTPEHVVSVDILKLPQRLKPVLTLWGSIYVKDS